MRFQLDRSLLALSNILILLIISGSLASYSDGKSRYSDFRGCNESAPLPSVDTQPQQDESSSSSSVSPSTQSSTTDYPQNSYFNPVILGPQSVSSNLNKNSFEIGNRYSFGPNRFQINPNSYIQNDVTDDKVPSLRPGANRLSQFQQSAMSMRNTISGNRFFDMDSSTAFLLYTRNNPTTAQKLQLNSKDLLDASDFNPDKPTKIIIHGFSEIGSMGEWVSNLKDAYLSTSETNVIVADFSTFQTFLLFWTNLPVFASKRIADIVIFLELTTGSSRENFHLIARSWGAHVAGVTGRLLQGRVGRITGLEPEARVYGTVLPDYKLVSTDAMFVDVVHVNGRRYFFHGSRFGLTPPSGHVDIYPNFSERNSGCPGTNNNYGRFNFGFCQRGRGVTYFTDSIKYPEAHPMCKCRSFSDYKSATCECSKENSKLYLGEYLANNTRGVFQLSVPVHNQNMYRMLQVFRQSSRM